MPYINEERREELDGQLSCATAFPDTPRSSGELNYAITRIVEDFLTDATEEAGREVPSYAMYNAAIGALESAKLELYRRAIAPYEDVKIAEQGDIGLYERVTKWAAGQLVVTRIGQFMRSTGITIGGVR